MAFLHIKFLLKGILKWAKVQVYPLKIALLFTSGSLFPLIIYARDVSSGSLALSFMIMAFITGFCVAKVDQNEQR